MDLATVSNRIGKFTLEVGLIMCAITPTLILLGLVGVNTWLAIGITSLTFWIARPYWFLAGKIREIK